MATSDEQWLFLQDVAKLIQFIKDSGHKATAGEMLRTAEQQALYVSRGASTTSHSLHLRKLAVDLNIFIGGIWVGMNTTAEAKALCQEIGDFWESLNMKNKWGGNWETFIDVPHFERRA